MLTITPNLSSIVTEDGAAILDTPRGQIITLNSTGAYIWDKLKQGKSVDELIGDLTTESNTDRPLIERDVREFLEDLMSKHLLVKLSPVADGRDRA